MRGTRRTPRGIYRRHAAIHRVVLNETNPIFTRAGGGRVRLPASADFPGSPAINARDRQELVRLEARAADQRAIDVGDVQQLLGVRRLYRSTVEDADALSLLSQARPQVLPDERMRLCDVGWRRREPAADSPDGLVSNDKTFDSCAVRHRTIELRPHHRERASVYALGAGLTNADDGAKSRAARGQ